MDLNLLMQSITTVGFPIVCCIGMAYFIWKMYTKMTLTLDKVTDTNQELVMISSNLMKSMDLKIDKIEEKVEKLVDKTV